MTENNFLNLKRYEVKKQIGEGSFGKVYIVQDKKTKQIYAAKIAKKKVEKENPKEMLNISREVNIISKIRHPSILQFIGYSPISFNKKSKPVIITEFSPNGTLKDILDLERKNKTVSGLDNTKKLIIIYGIANGMAYLHENSIIHRDLKPDNIFLDDYLCPKIADFGLSKINNESLSISSLKTTKGELKGTPLYISPEIWISQEYSFAGDVYAYSLIMYEILTGEQPFQGYNMLQLLADVGRKGKRPEFKKKIPESFKNLITSCWSQLPKDRPTFDQIIEQLKNDPSFIFEGVVREDYLSYIEFIEKSKISFDSNKKIIHLSDIVNNKSKTYQKVSINTNKKIKKELKKIVEVDKIQEEEKITESEPKTTNKLKFVSNSTFNSLDEINQKLVLDAENGDERSILTVAENFIEGINEFPKETETGSKYYEYCISLKNVEAMEKYGILLYQGEKVPKNENKAIEILSEAAEEHNNLNSKIQLSKIILSHESFDIDESNEDINYVLAKRYLKEAADSGHIESILRYAELSQKEKKSKFGEIHCDMIESFNYYKKAADLEDPEGIALYGELIETGIALTKPDPEVAIKYYKKSYDMGSMTGCALLGAALYSGIGGLIKNEEDGEKLINLSKENNNLYGFRKFVVLLIHDQKEQFLHFKKMIELKDPLAFFNLGICYNNGRGVEKDIQLGIKYLERGIQEGYNRGALILGMNYKEGIPEINIQPDREKAKKYLKYCVDKGYVDAICVYVFLLMEDPNLNDYLDEFERALQIGANAEDANCLYLYANFLFTGIVIPKNLKKSAKYAKMAADAGEKQAMTLYANMLKKGLGVEKDEKEAMKYTLMAKDESNEDCLIQ